mmetsp:Transcript_10989/g.23115  ORF Transcript_10989/g.23115 Transcript_10989/m.23115 type:complete len:230 (+) Transcript_10989:1252-1941(+)
MGVSSSSGSPMGSRSRSRKRGATCRSCCKRCGISIGTMWATATSPWRMCCFGKVTACSWTSDRLCVCAPSMAPPCGIMRRPGSACIGPRRCTSLASDPSRSSARQTGSRGLWFRFPTTVAVAKFSCQRGRCPGSLAWRSHMAILRPPPMSSLVASVPSSLLRGSHHGPSPGTWIQLSPSFAATACPCCCSSGGERALALRVRRPVTRSLSWRRCSAQTLPSELGWTSAS